MEKNMTAGGRAEGHKKERMANLELLRCVAMMMVVVLHYLGKGNLLPDLAGEELGTTGTLAWLLECFCIVAVNVYMFISGYFLCTSSFRPGRLLGLWLQIWLYSMVFGLAAALAGIVAETPVDTHYFLTLLFPVSMDHYWFMTAYVFLYLLLPFVGMAVRKMTKEQLGWAAALLLLVFCVLKSVLPLRLETDQKGYDCLWYLCVFVSAAYVRRFGVPFLEKRGRGFLLYVVCSLLSFGGIMGFRAVYLRTGSLGMIIKICLEYNHILPFLAAVGLFAAFRRIRVSGSFALLVNKVAPCTLGVYLLHENLGLRYTWQQWLGADRISSPAGLLLGTAAAVVVVFTCGILADMVRKLIMKGLDRLLQGLDIYRRQKAFLEKADEVFRLEQDPEKKA